MLALDHVLMAVTDLDAASASLWDRHGLASLAGGVHPGVGTANRIVPLAGAYLELIAVADPDLAGASVLGRAVARDATPEGRLMAWCACDGDIAARAARIGVDGPEAGTRRLPGGALLSWRLAGLAEALAEPCLPFLIDWDEPARHPGASPAPHRAAVAGVRRLEVTGDVARLHAWAGDLDVALRVAPGPPAVRRVVVATAGGDLTLG